MKSLVVFFGIVSLFVIPGIASSESTLWDLLISASVENEPLFKGENPMVTGQVINHAGKPVSNVDVKIRLDVQSAVATTDEKGFFSHEFTGLDLLPGTHIINIMGTSQDEKIGLTSTQFQVKGELQVSSQTSKLLQTPEATKYLNAKASDFENDSIGITLFNYYQELQRKLVLQESIQKKIVEQDYILEQHRKVSTEISQKIIDEKNPGAGTYSGWKKDVFVDNLDPSVKGIIKNQLNYTLNVFSEAQKAMNEVLQNGGTMKEAREAYLVKATVPRDVMEGLTIEKKQVNATAPQTEEIIIPVEIMTNSTLSNAQKSSVDLIVNGTSIKVGSSQTTIYLNINGTLIEFIINGTQIIPVTNSSQN
ncbi:hypothetical protein C6988_06640 [Nitrosopumilus sp. b1]|nr:hypothetical protein C6988_06640 [Nitrosopumilus sp. b1]